MIDLLHSSVKVALVQPFDLIHERSHTDNHAWGDRTQNLGVGLALEHLRERPIHHISYATKLFDPYV